MDTEMRFLGGLACDFKEEKGDWFCVEKLELVY